MKAIHCNDLANTSSIREVEVMQKGKDTSTIKLQDGEVTCVYNFELFPVDYKDRLLEVVANRQELKKAYDDSISLVYCLRNDIANNI